MTKEKRIIILKEINIKTKKNKVLFVPINEITVYGVSYQDEQSPTYDEVILPWHEIKKIKTKKVIE